MPFVYIVRCADGSLYTGWAVDVDRRVKTHNAGRGARYTRSHRPVELVYSEELPTRTEAMKRELAIKAYSRAKKLALCKPPPKKRRRAPSPRPKVPGSSGRRGLG
ncbi:MAG: GIY-YIG nuclease family protein [Anaerolineales bacterium]